MTEKKERVINHVRTTVYRLPDLTPLRIEMTVANARWLIGPGGDEW